MPVRDAYPVLYVGSVSSRLLGRSVDQAVEEHLPVGLSVVSGVIPLAE